MKKYIMLTFFITLFSSIALSFFLMMIINGPDDSGIYISIGLVIIIQLSFVIALLLHKKK